MGKKIVIVVLIVALLIIGSFFIIRSKIGKKVSINIDGEEYTFILIKYTPPYIYDHLLKSKEESNASTPEGTLLALASAVGRDKEWYLSLYDKSGQEWEIKADERSGGKILEEYAKNEPLLDPKRDGPKLYYKVLLTVNNKQYAIINATELFDGKEEKSLMNSTVFVKKGNIWLRTRVLKEHPITHLVGLNSYEQLQEIIKKGIWTDPIKHKK